MCITSKPRRRFTLTFPTLSSHQVASLKAPSFSRQHEVSTRPTSAPTKTTPSLLSIEHTPMMQSESQEYNVVLPFPSPPTCLAPDIATTISSCSSESMALPEPQMSSHVDHHSVAIIQHDYHDHSSDPVIDPSLIRRKAKGGVVTPFPVKLHQMLDQIEDDGHDDVVSWQPHGRCFVVHNPTKFVDRIMPEYFKQTKMASFQRQLNLYGFNRMTGNLDKGGYYHELFLRGKISLAYGIKRMRVKGTGVRLPTNPNDEPNFYALPFLTRVPAVVFRRNQEREVASVASEQLCAKKKEDNTNLNATITPIKIESSQDSEVIDMAQDAQQDLVLSSEYQEGPPRKDTEGLDVVFFEGQPFHYIDPTPLAKCGCCCHGREQRWDREMSAALFERDDDDAKSTIPCDAMRDIMPMCFREEGTFDCADKDFFARKVLQIIQNGS